MPYEIDYREGEVDTNDEFFLLAAKGALTPGDFQVPGDASRITEIRVTGSVDYLEDLHQGCSTAVHLTGPGISKGFHSYPGPCFGAVGATTYNAGLVTGRSEVYHTNIPVVAGSEITAFGICMGEDPGAAIRIQCNIVYDGIPGRIIDCDYREGNLAAANTPISLSDRAGSASGDFKTTGSQIVEVRCNGGMAAVAGLLCCTTDYHLSGAGLIESGTYNFGGRAYASSEDIATAGGGSFNVNSVRHVTTIGVDGANHVNVTATMLNEDVGSIWAIAALCYG